MNRSRWIRPRGFTSHTFQLEESGIELEGFVIYFPEVGFTTANKRSLLRRNKNLMHLPPWSYMMNHGVAVTDVLSKKRTVTVKAAIWHRLFCKSKIMDIGCC